MTTLGDTPPFEASTGLVTDGGPTIIQAIQQVLLAAVQLVAALGALRLLLSHRRTSK